MRLPNLLIIGAMKSGTTGVFMDLCRHPRVFVPQDKEPHALISDNVLTDQGRAAYAEHYQTATQGQLLCDASTVYSKRPDIEHVARRAVAVLPNNFRVVYLVREPIDRIVSHHYHEYIEGTVDFDIDTVVRTQPRLLNYSRYAYQLEPWREAIGNERIRVVRFEDYTSQRGETIAQLCKFLELPLDELPSADSTVHNRSEEKTVKTKFWQTIQESGWYRFGVRRLLSPRLRTQLLKRFLPQGPERPAPPSEETLAWLRTQLRDDVRQISAIAGSSEPLWPGYE